VDGGWGSSTVGIVTVGNAFDHLLRAHAPAVRTYDLYVKELS
jgi:hypothetical protein